MSQEKIRNEDIVSLDKSKVGLGNVDNTADSAKNVLSATKLTTARAINGVNFDGSDAITIYDSTKVPTTTTVNGHALSSNVTVTAGDVGLGNVINESKTTMFTNPTFTGHVTVPTPTDGTDAVTKNYADGLVVGLWDDRGSYDASGNSYPSTGGSGTAGAILKGDIWTISVAGTLGGVAVNIGDTVRALVDTPAQTASNWAMLENNIGYTPENVANKVTAFQVTPDDTHYISEKLAKDSLDAKLAIASKATGDEIDTGTDDTKYVTSKAIADSKVILADKQTSGNILRTPKTGIFASGSTTYQKTDATVTSNSLIDLYAQGTTIGQWEVESFAGYFIITSTETETSNVNFYYFINNI